MRELLYKRNYAACCFLRNYSKTSNNNIVLFNNAQYSVAALLPPINHNKRATYFPVEGNSVLFHDTG